MYGFEIKSGRNSWTCSKTTLTCNSRNLDGRMKNPVYLDGYLHWLKKDGSIVAFNPETEKARLIQTQLPNIGLGSETLFALEDNNLTTLVSNKEGFTYIYALKNILTNPKWVLVKHIKNGTSVKDRVNCKVGAYNGKCLLLGSGSYDRAVLVYDLSANEWVVMDSLPIECDPCQDFFLFTPSPHSVVGLDEKLAYRDKRISSLSTIMTLVDPNSPENRLMKMSGEEKEEEMKLLLYKQNTNKKRRVV
ncbi:unnamed protein product [Eruca vesicaria subsp. sativa]|uniref:Uncharacterized protein n=1 Tax=Eruca vesicaria subsp. sativa TaxID=29727 RepID=A0ABC8LJ88_ERUVS|nr:unnamed protein product [Eruca vesicaria subsp. sativa]